MSTIRTSVSNSFTMRLRITNKPGMLSKVLHTVAEMKGDPGNVDVIRAEGDYKLRDLTVSARDDAHIQAIINAVKKLGDVRVEDITDHVFSLHKGGKIRIRNTIAIDSREALSMAYTPGVGRVCKAIAEDKKKSNTLTIKQNSVAVVSDGSAVLGMGNIGPEAAMPVMEGKAMLFKEFSDIDAYPICLNTQNASEIVKAVEWMSPGFGGINLEDISAPRCFEVERKLKESLNIPVFHDDQHGTAVVVLAATINALKLVGKNVHDIRVVVVGAGAAGMAITQILKDAGTKDILCCDSKGIITRDRMSELNESKKWVAKHTNPDNLSGTVDDAASGADILIGVSGPESIQVKTIQKMNKDSIVFALANPIPEIYPEKIDSIARIIATGRSDYPNQINNVLAFPGMFRGALDARATDINEEMKLAAAHAIAGQIDKNELKEDYIIPDVFNKQVVLRVSRAVKEAAEKSGIVR